MGGKFEEEKKVEKKRAEVIASAGDAEAGKEGFGKDNGREMGREWAGIQHALHGRADCLRFASPAEALGGLGAWRLGGLESCLEY